MSSLPDNSGGVSNLLVFSDTKANEGYTAANRQLRLRKNFEESFSRSATKWLPGVTTTMDATSVIGRRTPTGEVTSEW